MTKTLMLILAISLLACNKKEKAGFTGADGEVKLMTLDPGHFHAALILKKMYPQMNPEVFVFAPDGQDLQQHIQRIDGFNSRQDEPTNWNLSVYTGTDYFEKMLAEKPGNLMNVSGNNARKTEYILKSVEAGINVLADKPMAITPENFSVLEKAFAVAQEKGVLLYDVMTERYEITTTLQRELSMMPEVFGELTIGTPEKPAITKESVHHFYKYVAGSPLTRPQWFFDTQQQGEGIVDVNTHLIDLIQWEAFPDQILHKEDVNIVSARRWITSLTSEMFAEVTKADRFPDFLLKDVDNDTLKIYCNGEIVYQLKGVYAKASVIWNYKAPKGAADTHYSIMRGTKCNLVIEQGAKENYQPRLYIEGLGLMGQDLQEAVKKLEVRYPGLEVEKIEEQKWAVVIPDKYREGHEAHFAQVTEKFLGFLKDGKLPEWEVPNMITKYYTTTEALKVAN